MRRQHIRVQIDQSIAEDSQDGSRFWCKLLGRLRSRHPKSGNLQKAALLRMRTAIRRRILAGESTIWRTLVLDIKTHPSHGPFPAKSILKQQLVQHTTLVSALTLATKPLIHQDALSPPTFRDLPSLPLRQSRSPVHLQRLRTRQPHPRPPQSRSRRFLLQPWPHQPRHLLSRAAIHLPARQRNSFL